MLSKFKNKPMIYLCNTLTWSIIWVSYKLTVCPDILEYLLFSILSFLTLIFKTVIIITCKARFLVSLELYNYLYRFIKNISNHCDMTL